MDATFDVAIIGAGAAGLATGIFLGRKAPRLRIAVLDGARRPGAKILVSGGSRCNVTNAEVTEHDFNGGRRPVIRRVLRAFPASAAVEFFRELGVGLHEEEHGKLFPDTNRSRDVLDALLRALASVGVPLRADHRVHAVARDDAGGFLLETSRGAMRCGTVVLATGGLSLPKTGSDGAGYRFARALGHAVVATTPALVPLRFDAASARPWHAGLSGVALPAVLRATADDRPVATITGALLWTHFGISGPAALDVSRHWLRARQDGHAPGLRANVLRLTFEAAEAQWLSIASMHPRQSVTNAAATLVPAAVAAAAVAHAGIDGARVLADLPRFDRRRLLHTLTDWPLPVTDSRGYDYAEVTAGGVALDEVDPGTLESRRAPGLFLVGEVLDVDGRLGGFNFQWAWSSAYVAAGGIAATARRA